MVSFQSKFKKKKKKRNRHTQIFRMKCVSKKTIYPNDRDDVIVFALAHKKQQRNAQIFERFQNEFQNVLI